MYEEFDELDSFYHDLFNYVKDNTVFTTYEKMTEESRMKWRERLTIMACKEFSPRRNFDISKDEVRALVADAIEVLRVTPNGT